MGKKEEQALAFAVNNGNLADVQKLLAKDKSLAKYVQSNGLSMLHVAAMKNHPAIVTLLITAGADVNFQSQAKDSLTPDVEPKLGPETREVLITIIHRKATPLISAFAGGNIAIVRALVSVGARVGGQEVYAAAFYGNLDILKFIVEKAESSKYGQNWREYRDQIFGNSALHNAVHGGFACVEFLLQSGFDINAVNARGTSVLILALIGLYYVENGGRDQLAIVNLLCKSGIDLELPVTWILRDSKAPAKKPMLYTALHYAAVYAQFEMVALLLSYRAKIDTRANMLVIDKTCYFSGATPFYFASFVEQESNFKVMELLYHCGADIDAVVCDSGKWAGRTALKEAEAGSRPTVAAFIRDLSTKRRDPTFLAKVMESVKLRISVEEEACGVVRQLHSIDPSTVGRSLAIKSSELTVGEKIGEGGFGVVYKAKWQSIDVALKQLRGTLSTEASTEFFKEAGVMLDLRHPNIVQLYGICPDPCSMVMEYMAKGSLYGVLHKENLAWSIKGKIAYGVSVGMSFLHSRQIVHRDLKSLNVLLTATYDPKIGDFGLAKVKQPQGGTATTATGLAGTPTYMAPELFSGKSCTVKSDMYALAVVLWEILTGKSPFESISGVYQLIMLVAQGGRETIPTDAPKFYADLIRNCWDQDPEKRPEMSAVVTYLDQHKSEFGDQQASSGAGAPSTLTAITTATVQPSAPPLTLPPPSYQQQQQSLGSPPPYASHTSVFAPANGNPTLFGQQQPGGVTTTSFSQLQLQQQPRPPQ